MTVVVDTSALMAILLGEPEGRRCVEVLSGAEHVALSAGTLAEALIVGGRRGCRREMEELLRRIGADVVPVTAGVAVRVAESYEKWGKGVHPAGLNFGDCFAHALAVDRNDPLLFVGDDFSRTDAATA